MSTTLSVAKQQLIANITKTMHEHKVESLRLNNWIFYRNVDKENKDYIVEVDIVSQNVHLRLCDAFDWSDEYAEDLTELEPRHLHAILHEIAERKYSILNTMES